MGEQILKFIVNKVNKLLNTDYNMISFDSLSKNALLQIFVDCLNKMVDFPKMDVERNADEALTKLVRYLSNIKVQMPDGVDANEFADGMIQGKRKVVQSTLHWILLNEDEVKKRSYLSKYLMKVELNPIIINDHHMEPLLEQYDELIKEFKKVYTQTTRFSKVAKATFDLRNDIEKQIKDLANILELIGKQKAKMENIPNKETLLVSVKALRSEVTAEKVLLEQITNQTDQITQLETDLKNMTEELKEQRNVRQSASGPLNKLQEDVQTGHMIVQERMPYEYEGLKSQLHLVENIATDAEPSESNIASLQDQVDQAMQDIQIFIEKTMLSKDPRDEKLAQFRQHAAVITNNKQLATEQYMELKEEFGLVCRQIEEKEGELQKIIGGALPQGEDLKNFVSKLRDQSVFYKESRAQLQELQIEVGVLARTQDILHEDEPTLVEAFQNKNDNNLTEEDEVPQDISELKQICKELISKTNVVKFDITNIRKQIQTAKDGMEDLNKRHHEHKEEYDSALSEYNNNVTKLHQEVIKLEENVSKEEETWKELRRSIDEKEMLFENLYKESVDGNNENKKTHLELLHLKTKEKENRRQQLEEDIRRAEKDKEDREEQVNLWRSTLRVLQCKRENRY